MSPPRDAISDQRLIHKVGMRQRVARRATSRVEPRWHEGGTRVRRATLVREQTADGGHSNIRETLKQERLPAVRVLDRKQSSALISCIQIIADDGEARFRPDSRRSGLDISASNHTVVHWQRRTRLFET